MNGVMYSASIYAQMETLISGQLGHVFLHITKVCVFYVSFAYTVVMGVKQFKSSEIRGQMLALLPVGYVAIIYYLCDTSG